MAGAGRTLAPLLRMNGSLIPHRRYKPSPLERTGPCVAHLSLLMLCTPRPPRTRPALTPRTLEAALAAKPQGADAERLAERIRAYFGAEALLKGSAAPKIDELMVAWAVEVPAPAADAPPAASSPTPCTSPCR